MTGLSPAARGADVLVSEAIGPAMTQSLGKGASAAGRDRTAAIMHDIDDYHITPEQAARIANQAGVRLLAFYHLLPAPDGVLARRLFAHGLSDARQGEWTIGRMDNRRRRHALHAAAAVFEHSDWPHRRMIRPLCPRAPAPIEPSPFLASFPISQRTPAGPEPRASGPRLRPGGPCTVQV